MQATRSTPTDEALPFRGDRFHPWFFALAERLKRTYILCTDWSRCLSPTLLGITDTVHNPCGIFFDPPYATKGRGRLYRQDNETLALDVQKWAIENQDNPYLKICIAGYANDYNPFPDTWERVVWSTSQNRMGRKSKGNWDRTECLWFSPNCLSVKLMEG